MKINCIHHVNQQPQTKSLQKTSTISLGKTNYHKLSEPTDVNYSQHLKNFTNIKPIQFTTNKNKKLFTYSESTKQQTLYDNYCSTDHLIENQNHPKISRESQNIHLIKNINKILIPNTKSALALITNPKTEPIQNSKPNILTTKETDNNEILDLLQKIKSVQIQNQKIKQQNIQLRIIKLSNGSNQMSLLKLKLQIQQIIRNIQKQKYKKNTQKNNKNSYNFHSQQLKNRKMSTCSSNSPHHVRFNSIKNQKTQKISPQMFSSALVHPYEFDKIPTLQTNKKQCQYFSPIKHSRENSTKQDNILFQKRLIREDKERKRQFSPYCMRK